MANTPATFVVEDDPEAIPYPGPWYAMDSLEEVTKNSAAIERLAHQYGLDPDFVKAIVWMESTHGWYDRFSPNNKTIRPMNVHDTLWAQLGISRADLQDPTRNIAAGVHILAMIWERTPDPTVEKVASLYNQLGAQKVNGYGKTVAQYMQQKPWLKKPAKANSHHKTCSACHGG